MIFIQQKYLKAGREMVACLWFLTIWSLLICLSTGTTHAAVYSVGPGKIYPNLQAVAGLLLPGDIVEVEGAAVYPGDVVFTRPGTPEQKITIRGIRRNGKRPVISGGTNTVHFMTDWPYSGPGGDHYVMEGFEITGGLSRGIFHQADDLTLRDIVVHDCPAQGILGADQGSGSLLMEYVEVYNCGQGTQRHQIYMATDEVHYPGSVFRMQHCYVHDGIGGNNVKTRAERNEIYYNWIEGAYYHELEAIGPDEGDGGNPNLAREDSDIVGNVFVKTRDFAVVRVGGDGTGETYGRYRFVNNTFICSSSAVFRLFDGIESIRMSNNVFFRPGGIVNILRKVDAKWTSAGELIAGSHNWVQAGSLNVPAQWTGTIVGANPGFMNAAALDLRPASNSPLLDAGTASPPDLPAYPFPAPLFPPGMHPPLRCLEITGSAESRPVDGAVDIGAFEFPDTAFSADQDGDGDVDGKDLSLFIATGNYSALQAFASEFGKSL